MGKRKNIRPAHRAIKTISGFLRRWSVDRRVKVRFAELSYHVLPKTNLNYVLESEALGILWSTRGFPDLLTRHMVFEGLYQEDVLACLRALAKPGDVVYDVGGHHGLMAVVAARAVGDAGRVVTLGQIRSLARF